MEQVGSYSCCYQTIKWRVLCLQVLCQSCFSISWLVFVRLINAVLCVWGNPPRLTLLSIPEYGGHNGTEKMNLPRTIQKVYTHISTDYCPHHTRGSGWHVICMQALIMMRSRTLANNNEVTRSNSQSTKGYGNDSRHYLISFCYCCHMR